MNKYKRWVVLLLAAAIILWGAIIISCATSKKYQDQNCHKDTKTRTHKGDPPGFQ